MGIRGEKEHPLVWHHRSGRKSLVLGSTAHYIEGMDQGEGRMILNRLREWATQPQFVYTHHWTEGDLLIWTTPARCTASTSIRSRRTG